MMMGGDGRDGEVEDGGDVVENEEASTEDEGGAKSVLSHCEP